MVVCFFLQSEQFLVMIRAVPMAKDKLKCLLLKLELPSRAENLKYALNPLEVTDDVV